MDAFKMDGSKIDLLCKVTIMNAGTTGKETKEVQ